MVVLQAWTVRIECKKGQNNAELTVAVSTGNHKSVPNMPEGSVGWVAVGLRKRVEFGAAEVRGVDALGSYEVVAVDVDLAVRSDLAELRCVVETNRVFN